MLKGRPLRPLPPGCWSAPDPKAPRLGRHAAKPNPLTPSGSPTPYQTPPFRLARWHRELLVPTTPHLTRARYTTCPMHYSPPDVRDRTQNCALLGTLVAIGLTWHLQFFRLGYCPMFMAAVSARRKSPKNACSSCRWPSPCQSATGRTVERAAR